jgi:CBS domain-containing protein
MDRSRFNRFVNQPLRELPLADAVFVDPSTSVRGAVEAIRESGSSCVLVGAPNDVQGIFTERDILTKCMGDDFNWDQPVGQSVVTRSPETISAERTIAETLAALQRRSYRTLPVLADGEVLGLIRTGDILRHFAEAFPEDLLNLPPRPHQVMERPEGG